MKLAPSLAGMAAMAVGMAFVIPFGLGLVGGGALASVTAAGWDIPASVLPILVAAGGRSGISWSVLAAIASVATDFGRSPPDGLNRSSVVPVVVPAISGHGGGEGIFLIDPAAPGHPDLQDVAATADWLAGEIARRAGPSLPDVVASLPLLIPLSGGSSIRQFALDLLGGLNDPPTNANVDAIVAWAAGEGSCARNNPLDTTQPRPGATPFNTLTGGGHVWNYPSPAAGLAATVETLNNGLYRPILEALKVGAGVAALEQAVRATPWGTGRFGSTTYAGPRCNGAPGAGGGSAAAAGGAGVGVAGGAAGAWVGVAGGAAGASVGVAGGGASIPDVIAARAAQYEALAATMAGGLPGPVPAGDHVLPVDRSWYEQHSEWFQRPHHDYPAIDIPVPAGTPVFAVAAGTVVAADDAGGTTACGHDVLVRDSSGVTFTYCHGSQVMVTKGQPVAAGQLLLRSGWSGAVLPPGPAGAHLHFQINVPGVASTSCPQPALAAWAAGRDVDLRQLPTTGCVSGHI